MALRGNARSQDRNGTQPQRQEKSGTGNRPVYSKRYWTGSGSVEVSTFAKEVENGNNPFTSYATVVKRHYKDGETWKDTPFLKQEDLLTVAHGLTQAFAWIASQGEKE